MGRKQILFLGAGTITFLLLVAGYHTILAFRGFSSLRHEKQGELFIEKEQYVEAVKELQLAVKLKPDFAGAHCYLGIALYHQGELDAAINQFHDAIRLMPSFSSAYYYLGNAFQGKGRKTEARAAWRKVLALPDRTWATAAQEQLNKYPEITL